MCKYYDLYDFERISGIDADVLAGMIEENRIQADLRGGVYCITKDSFIKWAENVMDQMLPEHTQW